MRTTSDLSAEALAKSRQLARQRSESIGTVASELILQSLEPEDSPEPRNGVPVIPMDAETNCEGAPPDPAPGNRLRDLEL